MLRNVLKFDRSYDAVSKQSGSERELTGYCKCATWQRRWCHFSHNKSTLKVLPTVLHCHWFTLWSWICTAFRVLLKGTCTILQAIYAGNRLSNNTSIKTFLLQTCSGSANNYVNTLFICSFLVDSMLKVFSDYFNLLPYCAWLLFSGPPALLLLTKCRRFAGGTWCHNPNKQSVNVLMLFGQILQLTLSTYASLPPVYRHCSYDRHNHLCSRSKPQCPAA